jgi:hypothetical protein
MGQGGEVNSTEYYIKMALFPVEFSIGVNCSSVNRIHRHARLNRPTTGENLK